MRSAIWKAMLDADMNAKYWKYLTIRYSFRDRALKIFMAIVASSTVAGWGLWESVPWLWKTLSSLSALIAVTLPFLTYHKTIEQVSYLSGKWSELRIEYEDLWLQVRTNPEPATLERAFKKSRRLESSLQQKEAMIPEDRDLLMRCFKEVRQSRGLA